MINVVIKDLKLLLAERKSLLIFFLMPIVLTTILSFALQGSFTSETPINTIHLGIVKAYDLQGDLTLFQDKFDIKSQGEIDLDLEGMFFENFLEDDSLEGILTYEVMSKEDAEEALSLQSIDAMLILPEGFIYNQMVNFLTPYRNEIEIQIRGRADQQFSSKMVYDIMTMYFDANNLKIIQKNSFLKATLPQLGIAESMTYIEDLMSLENAPGEIVDDVIPGYKTMSSFTYYGIAMMAMFVLYAASFSGKALLREKQDETLGRNTIAGVSYTSMLLSKFIMTFVLVIIQVVTLLTYSSLLLRVPWVISLELGIGIIFTGLAISGFGSLLIGLTLFFDNPNLPAIFENVLIHIFALVGGSYIPVEVLPTQVTFLKVIAVNGMILDLFIKIYQEAKLVTLLPQVAGLLIFSIASLTLGLVLISRKEGLTRA